MGTVEWTMTKGMIMTEKHRDRVVDEVVDKVQQHRSIDQDPELVRARVEDAVDDLLDKPVQTFTPLLAENQVVSELTADRPADDEQD
jgi:type IV secretory pathway TrbF-like protein